MPADLAMLADDEALAPLWHAVHARLCVGEAPEKLTTVRVAGLPRSGIAALRSLLDTTARRRRSRSAVTASTAGVVVPLRELLLVIGLDAGQLPALVERAVGMPVVDRSAAARAASARRAELWAYAAARLPQVPGLVAKLRATGVGEDDTDVRATIDALAAALPRLPTHSPVTLAKLAHDTAGDPHFFDLDTLAGARLVTAIAELTGQAEPTRPDLVRTMLAQVGVIADRLSATVLLLSVAAKGAGVIDRRLRDANGPVALTLFDLTETPPALATQTLTVVENPSVIEAALAIGATMPLACTSGHLRAVDHVLLGLAVSAGVRLRYAGDLDAGGLSIARTIMDLYGAELIAMDAATVRAAEASPSRVPLTILPTSADAELAALLTTHGRVVFQEHDEILRRIL